MTEFDLYKVGGCTRDAILGVNTKDIDVVAVPRDWEEWQSAWDVFIDMKIFLTEVLGMKYYTEAEEFYTVRGQLDGEDIDVVLARTEGPYSDQRHPDWVRPGTLEDDLNRRDFTCNAIAEPWGGGDYIDLNGGILDIKKRTLRFVGDPHQRIIEDPLRLIRALRFLVTKKFIPDPELRHILVTGMEYGKMIAERVADERKEEELRRMLDADQTDAIHNIFNVCHPAIRDGIFADRLRLIPTLKKGPKRGKEHETPGDPSGEEDSQSQGETGQAD